MTKPKTPADSGAKRLDKYRKTSIKSVIEAEARQWMELAAELATARLRPILRELDPDFYAAPGANEEAHVGAVVGAVVETAQRVLFDVVEDCVKVAEDPEADPDAFARSLLNLKLDLNLLADGIALEVADGFMVAAMGGAPSEAYGVRVISFEAPNGKVHTFAASSGVDDPAFGLLTRRRLRSKLPIFAIVGFSDRPGALEGPAVDAFKDLGFSVVQEQIAIVDPAVFANAPDQRFGVGRFAAAAFIVPPIVQGPRPDGAPRSVGEFVERLGLVVPVANGEVCVIQAAAPDTFAFLDAARVCFFAYLAQLPADADLAVFMADAAKFANGRGFVGCADRAEAVFDAMRAAGLRHGIYRDPKRVAACGGLLQDVFGRVGVQ